MRNTPLVYDVGMHGGEDSAYYLAKGFDVIGIDADTSRCESCRLAEWPGCLAR